MAATFRLPETPPGKAVIASWLVCTPAAAHIALADGPEAGGLEVRTMYFWSGHLVIVQASSFQYFPCYHYHLKRRLHPVLWLLIQDKPEHPRQEDLHSRHLLHNSSQQQKSRCRTFDDALVAGDDQQTSSCILDRSNAHADLFLVRLYSFDVEKRIRAALGRVSAAAGMSCPSWQWHRTGAAANLRPTKTVREQHPRSHYKSATSMQTHPR